MKRNSNKINVGNICIGGDSPISVQSMLNAPAHDIEKNVLQALELKNSGCNIIRVAVPDMESVKIIPAIKEKVDIPVVADIHFNHKLALESAAAGADKIRINPGNIGDESKVKAVADVCRNKNIPIRIGVNSGSIEKHLLEKYQRPSPEAMGESALYNASLLEKFDFKNILVSMKSSNVKDTVTAYRLIANKCDYPLHIGITEAGTLNMGTIKSAVGIGSLLLDSIGDTIRISLTDNPIKEVETGINILKALEMYPEGIDFITCPTCGRTQIDLINIAKEAEKLLSHHKKRLKVAIMGCVVNGPGEAKEADIGITGGNGVGIIFKKGEIFKKVKEENLLQELVSEVNNMLK